MLIVLNKVPGGVLKKWRIFEGGWMRFLEAISGLMKRLFLLPMKSCSRREIQFKLLRGHLIISSYILEHN